MTIDKKYYISTDNKRELWIMATGYLSPFLLQFDKPFKYCKRYRGMYKTSWNSPSAYNFKNHYIGEGRVKEITQREFDIEVDSLKVKLSMMRELSK